MIAIIALVLSFITWGMNTQGDSQVAVIPPMPQYSANELFEPCMCKTCENDEWYEYEFMALLDYADKFTALFNSYEVKVSKNGRTMIRQGNSGPYKFVKKGI